MPHFSILDVHIAFHVYVLHQLIFKPHVLNVFIGKMIAVGFLILSIILWVLSVSLLISYHIAYTQGNIYIYMYTCY